MRILSRTPPAHEETSGNHGRVWRVIRVEQEIDSVLVRAWRTAGLAELKPDPRGTGHGVPQAPAELKLLRKPAGKDFAKR
jgi:hypothetical protein